MNTDSFIGSLNTNEKSKFKLLALLMSKQEPFPP